MRYPAGHKESVRAKILAAASSALRAKGLTGIAIPALMKKAGLTHGGFYAHFESRDELVAESVRRAAEETSTRVFDTADGIDDVLSAYLSPEHAAHPERGCVVAALGAEGVRQQGPVRAAFADAARGLLAHVERKLHPQSRRALSDEALELTARMVGAVVLARLVHDRALAHRILSAATRPPAHE